jgi:hypothetical protein
MGRKTPAGSTLAPPRRALLGAVLLVAGCAGPPVGEARLGSPAGLPRPARILVADVAIRPEEVLLDSAIRAEVERGLAGRSVSEAQFASGRAAGRVIADTIASTLQAQGFTVERVGATPLTAGADTLVVASQLLFVDEGNSAERRVIGFGAGRSRVRAQSQVVHLRPGAPPRPLEDFEVEADSPRTPGLAAGLGAGAASGRIIESAMVGGSAQVFAERQRGSVRAEAERAGRALGEGIARYVARRGWR